MVDTFKFLNKWLDVASFNEYKELEGSAALEAEKQYESSITPGPYIGYTPGGCTDSVVYPAKVMFFHTTDLGRDSITIYPIFNSDTKFEPDQA